MAVAALITVGIVLALAGAVAYYHWKVKRSEDRASAARNAAAEAAEGRRVAEETSAAVEMDRAARDAERFRQAQERAKNATLPTALDDWTRASDRMHENRNR